MEDHSKGNSVRGRVVDFPGRPADVKPYLFYDVTGEAPERRQSRGRLGLIIIFALVTVGVAVYELVKW